MNRACDLRVCSEIVILALALVGCVQAQLADGGSGSDGGDRDAGPSFDGGSEPDAGDRDAGPSLDAAARDGGDDGGGGSTLSDEHPGDVGLDGDLSVVWFEDFEEGSIATISARYDQVMDNGRLSLVTDTPSGTGSALAMRAGQGQEAVELYKRLPGHEEWYVRWYARYETGVPWHHAGMWFGGYNPPMGFPMPRAGNRPNGDERFSIAIEPVFGDPIRDRFDFYNYWMGMRSWMAAPIMDDGTAFYGNTLVHRNDFTLDAGSWVCLEVHVRLNTDPSSGAGAVLEVWKNDTLMASFDESGPRGYWTRDKFCRPEADGVDGAECTDFPAPATEILGLQYRSTTALQLNAFWPQNYITADAMGTLAFDQMVVATRRVGCMR